MRLPFRSGTPDRELCAVAPSPQLRERMREQLGNLRENADLPLSLAREPRLPGFNDGTILPPSSFPAGTPLSTVRNAAADRAPLRGTLRVIVVLVDFTDKRVRAAAARFEDLFFSTGHMPTGSVTEYYQDVTGGLIDIAGEVVGPFTMPQTLAWYANGNYGIGKPSGEPRANILAEDAAKAADPSVDFGPYDNDGNGYVDAFIVVHAGAGGEETGQPGRHLVAQVGAARGVRRRRHQGLRLPDDPRGREARCLRPRARPPAVRLPRPLRHRLHLRGHRQLVPDGRRLVERRR